MGNELQQLSEEINRMKSEMEDKISVDEILDEERKFAIVARLVIDEFPKMLRILLKKKWNEMVRALKPLDEQSRTYMGKLL